MHVTSTAFENRGRIPLAYASTRVLDGQNQSPSFEYGDMPPGTVEAMLVFYDRTPEARGWVHWLVSRLPAQDTRVRAGASGGGLPHGARELANTLGTEGYEGPFPPPGAGEHTYALVVLALGSPAGPLPSTPTMDDVRRAVAGRVLDEAAWSGLFSR